VVLLEPGRMALRDIAPPIAGDTAALVRVRRIGLCGTDLHAFEGTQPFFTYPRVLGHELAVTVESVPDGETRLRPGDGCAVRPFLFNPGSRASRRGRTNCCEDLRVLGVHVDGGMGERLAIAPEFLHPSEALSLDELCLVEPLSIGCHAVSRGQVTDADEVLVAGAGPVGLAVTQFALLAGGRVTVLDLAEGRLDFVRRHLGAAVAVSSLDAASRYDCVFDVTGNAASMRGSFDRVAAGGRLVFVGLVQSEIGFSDPKFHKREITLLASRNATAADFTRVMLAIQAGHVRPEPWITHRLSLEVLPDRFAGLRRETSLVKAMVEL
jgi:2-desacetyl-2-hydroxyethyl bacteriochlorophyllide A dehydrogenase